jgi:alginate O-acetyltransferase complex protein AlgI
VLFFDGAFLLFLGVLALALLAVRSVRGRVWVLTAASYACYAAWDWRYVPLLFGCTAFPWLLASRMPSAGPAGRRRLLVLSLAGNLGVLALFKYLDFGLGTLNTLFGLQVPLAGLALPVGVSFFTFQAIAYTLEVYRGNLEPCRFASFLHFVSFFPSLSSGPILRAGDYLAQVRTALATFPNHVAEAVPLFVLGLFKKVVVADHVTLLVDQVFRAPAAHSSLQRVEAALGFTVQIYCDFSGYTDMALALLLLFGFRFPLNFRSPYLSRGPQEFWRRWHISLSTWLRDFLYKPLGGSRQGPARTYFALLMTMLLGGLWHGAAWGFVLWGLYHGTLLVLERLVRERVPAVLRRALTPLSWLGFMALTLVGWTLFRADSLAGAAAMLDHAWWPTGKSLAGDAVLWAACGFVAVEHVLGEVLRARESRPAWWPYLAFAVAGLMLAGVLLLRPVQNIPFIYFQF